MIRFSCPRCHTALSALPEHAGRVSQCPCGQQFVVPRPSADSTPADRTALGQMVGHSPTQMPAPPGSPSRPAGKSPPVGKLVKGPASPDKTALGQVVSHNPTGLIQSPARGKGSSLKKPVSQARSPGYPARLGPRLVLLLVLVFVTGGLFAGGLVWFLNTREPGPSPRNEVAKSPEQKVAATNPGTDPQPAKNQGDESKPQQAKRPEDAGKAQQTAKAEEKSAPAVNPDKAKATPPAPAPEAQQAKKPPAVEEQPPPVKPAPKPKEEIPAELSPLVAKLKTGTDEEQVKAAEQLALKGDKAAAAARALCEASVNPTKEVSRAALQALEKVAPDLYEPVFTLVVDGQAANHLKAIASLRVKGAKAKPALPVLVHQIRKCEADLKNQIANRFNRLGGGGWASNTLIQVIQTHLTALPDIAPEDPAVVDTVLTTTRMSFAQPFFADRFGRATTAPFRSMGIGILGELAAKRPEHRKVILPALANILEEAVQAVSSANQFTLLSGLSEVESVGLALLKCGPEAKQTLVKKVVPQLKELEFHKDAGVRSAAKNLRRRIEAGPSAGGSAFPVNGILAPGEPAKEYSLTMKAGKTYIITDRRAKVVKVSHC